MDSFDGPVPEINYARNGDIRIAYQTYGNGSVDVILVPGFISHIELAWTDPTLARFLRDLAAFSRVIAFDKRGMGMSDRDTERETPLMSERMDDIRAVMVAAASTSAVLLAWSEGGPTAISFAHRFPEATMGLVLVGTTPRFSSSDEFPDGIPTPVLEVFIDTLEEHWGSGVGFELYAPSLADDPRSRRWWATYQRLASSPGAVAASLRMHLTVDVTDLLPELGCPALVVHQSGDMVIPVECGRFMAERIPDAEMIEGAGRDHMFWLGRQSELLDGIADLIARTPSGQVIGPRKRSPRHQRTGWDALTRTELIVAELVATGLTNRQIANRLSVSPRTVQTHVTSILRKLDVQRRSAVADVVARHRTV